MGTLKTLVAVEAAFSIRRGLEDNPLGVVLGADGLLQIVPKLLRGPDMSSSVGSGFPEARCRRRVWPVVPGLAAEVLSPGILPTEMERKMNDYPMPGRSWSGSSTRPRGRRSCIRWISLHDREINSFQRAALTATSTLPRLPVPVAAVLRCPAGAGPIRSPTHHPADDGASPPSGTARNKPKP